MGQQSRSADITADLTKALAFHQSGRLAEAEHLYRSVLMAEPGHFDANHLLGVVLMNKGDAARAEQQFALAVQLNPSNAEAANNHGSALRQLKKLDEALTSFDRAITLQPGYPEALMNRAAVLRNLGRFEEALADYTLIETQKPGGCDAFFYFCKGITFDALGRPADALVSYTRALQLKPAYFEVLVNQGQALGKLGRPAEALAAYDKALALQPGFAYLLFNRGNALRKLQRRAEALASYDEALKRDPKHVAALTNRGDLLREMKKYEEALACYDRVLALQPDHAEIWLARGDMLVDTGRPLEAIDSFRKSLALKQTIPLAHGLYVQTLRAVCDWTDNTALEQETVRRVRAAENAVTPFCFLSLPSTAEDQLRCARTWVAQKHPPQAPLWDGKVYGHQKIRLAYLSADFHEHATAYLMAELFESHDRDKFEITALSFGPDDKSPMRERLKRAFDHFIEAREMTDDAAAALLREREVDIAVDLKGFTRDERADILARRPAPVQASFIGYPGTMGAPYIDYIIADPVVIPAGEERFYSEKIARMPDTYQPNDRKRAIAETPTRTAAGLPETGFVFCSFNNSYKITPQIFDIWMRLLAAVPGSVLWLLDSGKTVVENLVREAEKRGIAKERLVFAPRTPLAGHLARHRHADLFLDTLPYNAHTTASDALWTGLPVLTCPGDTFASRVAASLLRAAGMPELVAPTLAEYENTALSLACDPAKLAALRDKLAKTRDTCPLFDTARFARHLEKIYIRMHARAERGEAPDHINLEGQAP